MAEATVSAGYLQSLLDFARSQGGDAQALLTRAGIDATLLDDRDNRLPFARFAALMRAAKAESGPGAGIRRGERSAQIFRRRFDQPRLRQHA